MRPPRGVGIAARGLVAPRDTVQQVIRWAGLVLVGGLPALAQGGDPPGYLRPVEAGIWEVTSGVVQFGMRLGQPPPFDPDPSRHVTYMWCVDTDLNARTGWSHGAVGSEYNIRLVLRNGDFGGYGFVDDVANRRGSAGYPAFVAGARVYVRIPLCALGGATRFRWNCGADSSRTAGRHLSGTSQFEAGAADPDLERVVRVVIEPLLVLHEGVNSGPLPVRAYNRRGERMLAAERSARYFAYTDLARLNGARFEARDGVVGRARVTATVGEVLSCNTATIAVGSVELVPVALHLNPATAGAGRVGLRVADAGGQSLSLAGHEVKLWEDSRGAVATVDPDGTVRLRSDEVGQQTWVRASFDGVGVENQCKVDIVAPTAPAGPAVEVRGRETSFWYGPEPQPPDGALDWFAARNPRIGYAAGADAVYLAQWQLTGTAPFWGSRQHFVAIQGKGGGWGAHSGNPVPMWCDWRGWDATPVGWYGHEFGHNFGGASRLFNDLLLGPPGLRSQAIYPEGQAHWFSGHAMRTILRRPDHYGMTPAAVQFTHQDLFAGRYSRGNKAFLGAWLRSGKRYPAGCGCGELSGMYELLDQQFGRLLLPRFMSVFWPPDEVVDLDSSTEEKRSTFFVAAFSAAAKVDLRRQFREWGLPIDDQRFEQLLPVLTLRAGQRDAEFPAGAPDATDAALPPDLRWRVEPAGLVLAADDRTLLGPVSIPGATLIGAGGCPYALRYRSGEREVELTALLDPAGIRFELVGGDLTGLSLTAPVALGPESRPCRLGPGTRRDVALVQLGQPGADLDVPGVYDPAMDRGLTATGGRFTGDGAGGLRVVAEAQPGATTLSLTVDLLTDLLRERFKGVTPPAYEGHPGVDPGTARLAREALAAVHVTPLDLFAYPVAPSVWDLKVATEAGAWDVVALVNSTGHAKAVQVTLAELGLRPSGPVPAYAAYDLSRQQVLGPVIGDLLGGQVPPGGSRVFVVGRRQSVPWVLSPYGARCGGLPGLQRVAWDAAAGVLSGQSTGLPDGPLVVLATPPGARLASVAAEPGPAQAVVGPAGTVVRLNPARTGEVAWRARFVSEAEPAEPPSTPVVVTTPGRGGVVQLDWPAVPGAAGYRVQRNSRLVHLGPETAWADTGLPPGLQARYEVTAYDAAGRGSPASAPLYYPTGPAATVSLSSLEPDEWTQQWGWLSRDRSVCGQPLKIADRAFAHGWGSHAQSEVVYYLSGSHERFQAWVGVDAESGAQGTVVFKVRADGREIFSSGKMTGGAPAARVDVRIGGVTELRLVTEDGGDGNGSDHADWAEAVLVGGATP